MVEMMASHVDFCAQLKYEARLSRGLRVSLARLENFCEGLSPLLWNRTRNLALSGARSLHRRGEYETAQCAAPVVCFLKQRPRTRTTLSSTLFTASCTFLHREKKKRKKGRGPVIFVTPQVVIACFKFSAPLFPFRDP